MWFCILGHCNIAELIFELLALYRRGYEIRTFAARVVEWVAEVGYVCVVYSFEDLRSTRSTMQPQSSFSRHAYCFNVIVLHGLFGQCKHEDNLDARASLIAISTGLDYQYVT